MAVGDWVVGLVKIAAGGANTTYQPASGVTVILMWLSCYSQATTDDPTIDLYDGTVALQTLASDNFLSTSLTSRLNLLLDNSVYLRFRRNGTTDELDYNYGGLQVA